MSDIRLGYPADLGVKDAIETNDDPLPLTQLSLSDEAERLSRDRREACPSEVVQSASDESSAMLGSTRDRYIPWLLDRNGIGILPWSLCIILSMIFALLMTLFFVAGFGAFLLLPGLWYGGRGTLIRPMSIDGRYFATLVTSFIIWAPIAGILTTTEMVAKRPRRAILWSLRTACLFIFGVIIWGYCVLQSKSNVDYIVSTDEWTDTIGQAPLGVSLQGWQTGTVPKTFHGCGARMTNQQAPLFTFRTYQSQFARTYTTNLTQQNGFHLESRIYPAFDMSRFEQVRNNASLCDRGFVGNTDLYGLGIRCGVYFQWVSSLLANNFLSNTRQEIQKVYLVFSLAICLATLISSTTKSCIFSTEIEILYWMYWGGIICVFGSAPCSIRLGNVSRWVMVDWTGVILFTTYWIMTYHGIWFILRAYDQVFARMPCGTYHFFLTPLLDPSVRFWVLRDIMELMAAPVFALLLTAFPLVALLLIPEVKHAIQRSAVHQAFSLRELEPGPERADTPDFDTVPSLRHKVYEVIKKAHSAFRRLCNMPEQDRGGIRLVTPVDIEHRRFLRIRWAATGLIACLLSITAIELTLIWNKVVGVYSIDSTGQYIPVIIGIASFISACWSMIKQESERRRRLICHRAVSESGELYELQSLASAIGHAFAQPDVEFLMSGGLPNVADDDEQDIAEAGIPFSDAV